jgi:tRNA-dihydrouridine synthase B
MSSTYQLDITNKLVLAPMAGFTDSIFRSICKRFGADIVFTDLISAKAITYGNKETFQLMEFREDERPIGIQLYGSEPEVIAEAARIVVERFRPDIIDLNFGCPVRKVVRKNEGAALLKNPALMGKIVSSVVNVVSIPVSAKIRSGWDKSTEDPVSIGKILENGGVAFITLHPRTRTQGYREKANWEWIARLKESVNIPVIGNGDVRTPEDADRMFNQTGCDAVMIGRAALGNPWIFKLAKYFINTKVSLPYPDIHERFAVALEHLNLVITRMKDEYLGIQCMRKHLVYYTHNLYNASKLRRQIFEATTVEQIKDIFHRYMENEYYQYN